MDASLKAADIVIFATPTWLGQMSSVCLRALERLDAWFEETDDDGRPIAFGKVAGVVVTGNEDGAHNIVATVCQGLIDMGFTDEEVAAFDPSAHNVTEILEYLDSATDEERERVLAAEEAGDARKGVLSYSAPKEDPETPETPESTESTDETGKDGDA